MSPPSGARGLGILGILVGLGILGYFRATNSIYKALFVHKTLIIPFLISFLTLCREVVLTL